jgi:3-dehydroquinate synthase
MVRTDPRLSLPHAKLEAHSWYVKSQQFVEYVVCEYEGLFDVDQTALLYNGREDVWQHPRRFVVIDRRVDQLHGAKIRRYLDHHLDDYRVLTMSAKEQEKTMDAVFCITDALDSFALDRRHEPIIGIGGGVLLDIVGLTANLYRRGTPYIRVPTTLMGLVDAGIGVKTGVNFGPHKNRLGTYYPPLATFLDRTFLKTLDVRQIRNGLSEILKMALVADRQLFDLLEEHHADLVEGRLQDSGASTLVIRYAIRGMLDALEPNLWEKQLYRTVDFGHSFSPKLEMQALPELLHGEAVAIDMAISTVLSYHRGLIGRNELDRILRLVERLELPLFHPLCTGPFLHAALEETRHHRDGLQRLPLPTSIGSVGFFNDVTFEALDAAARISGQMAREVA